MSRDTTLALSKNASTNWDPTQWRVNSDGAMGKFQKYTGARAKRVQAAIAHAVASGDRGGVTAEVFGIVKTAGACVSRLR